LSNEFSVSILHFISPIFLLYLTLFWFSLSEKMAYANFKTLCVNLHNFLRVVHNAAPLKWDNTLEELSQSWAEHLNTVQVGACGAAIIPIIITSVMMKNKYFARPYTLSCTSGSVYVPVNVPFLPSCKGKFNIRDEKHPVLTNGPSRSSHINRPLMLN
jgi:hypothetical protein